MGKVITKDETEAGETFGLGLVRDPPRAGRLGPAHNTRTPSSCPLPYLPSAGARRGVSGNRDDEILVDLLAEFVAVQAAGGSADLRETGLPLRLAVSDVMAFWPA